MSNSDLRFRQIHLDFHTSEHIPGIGSNFDPEEFAATLERARVDSITCFARCHHGWIYFDTTSFDLAGFAFEHYPKDRASYHVSAESAQIPDLASLADGQLPRLLDHTDVRQVLHVTFGSVLERFQSRIVAVLISHEEDYYEALANHFERHLEPFVRGEG